MLGVIELSSLRLREDRKLVGVDKAWKSMRADHVGMVAEERGVLCHGIYQAGPQGLSFEVLLFGFSIVCVVGWDVFDSYASVWF